MSAASALRKDVSLNRLKFGLVGTRASGALRLRAARSRSDIEIVATSGPGPQRGIMHFEEPLGLLLRADLDGLIYAGEAGRAADVICAALRRGLHVLSLRPPGLSVEDVIAVREAEMASAGKVLQFSFPLHYHASVATAKSLHASGAFGRLLNMRAVYSTLREPGFAGRGGALFDKGMAMVDLMQAFAGPFTEVKSFLARNVWGDPGHDDDAHALLRTHDGVTASLHASATWLRETFRLEIGYERGYLWLDGLAGEGGALGPEVLVSARCTSDPSGRPQANPDETVSEFASENVVDLELADFLHSVRGRGAPKVGSSAHAFDAMNTIARLYAADETWQPRPGELDTPQAAQ